VLDGDMILLHAQERDLQARSPTESWKTAYKLPTSADRLVIEFRRWIDLYCQGQLPWGKIDTLIELPLRNRHQILDRYHQHTMPSSPSWIPLALIKSTISKHGMVLEAATLLCNLRFSLTGVLCDGIIDGAP
jgi:hypothetical protein